jgi:hypothetical protein
MSNYLFLKTEWPGVLESARKAESVAMTDPRTASFRGDL